MIYGFLAPENRLTNQDVHELIEEAVAVESHAVRESLPVALIGMNADSMIQYVKYVADQLLVELNAPKLYNVQNPFNWMALISIPGKTNFFERTNADYVKVSSAKTHSSSHSSSFMPKAKVEEEPQKEQKDEPYIASDLNF
jgi:ribonucleotide reductase beta subunit family protein with ferritin-like domain